LNTWHFFWQRQLEHDNTGTFGNPSRRFDRRTQHGRFPRCRPSTPVHRPPSTSAIRIRLFNMETIEKIRSKEEEEVALVEKLFCSEPITKISTHAQHPIRQTTLVVCSSPERPKGQPYCLYLRFIRFGMNKALKRMWPDCREAKVEPYLCNRVSVGSYDHRLHRYSTVCGSVNRG
jgi:hypothetical protein